jgi:hypothetical protein
VNSLCSYIHDIPEIFGHTSRVLHIKQRNLHMKKPGNKWFFILSERLHSKINALTV